MNRKLIRFVQKSAAFTLALAVSISAAPQLSGVQISEAQAAVVSETGGADVTVSELSPEETDPESIEEADVNVSENGSEPDTDTGSASEGSGGDKTAKAAEDTGAAAAADGSDASHSDNDAAAQSENIINRSVSRSSSKADAVGTQEPSSQSQPDSSGSSQNGSGQPQTETQQPQPVQPVSMKLTGAAGSDNIALTWERVDGAAIYTIYFSTDGSAYSKLTDISGADTVTYTHSGLNALTSYYYYIEAFDSAGVLIGSSEKQTFTTVKITTSVKGATKGFSRKARTTATDTIKVTGPVGRTLKLQMYDTSKKKWVTKKKFKLENTSGTQKIKVKYPKTWWYSSTSKWRYYIPASSSASAYKSGTIKVKTKRYYQNPSKYVQIQSKISKHGKKYYTYPVQTKLYYTRSQYVNAMINAAKKYLGDPYVVGRSGKTGAGVDCSGLVMQACYAAGIDLWPSNPYRHQFAKYEYESRYIARNKKLKTVTWKNRKKGDLIFYSKGGTIIHVAIYMGNGKIIHSWPGYVQISSATNPRWGTICKLKRIFV